MAAQTPIKILSQYFLTVLDEDVHLDDEIVPAGTTVLFAPQTTAHSVRVPGNKSLFEAWPDLAKSDHSHIELQALIAQYQSDTIDFMDRITKLELWAAKQGYEYYSNVDVKDISSFSLYEYIDSNNLVRDTSE